MDTDRWSGVPFTIRAGKEMATTAIEIIVELDQATAGYHHTRGAASAAPNLVRFRVSPRPGATFGLLSQHEGDAALVDEVAARVDFTDVVGNDTSAYEHVLHDAITGDPRRFCQMDMVEECWRVVGDILTPAGKPALYRPGSWGPAQADRLVTDGRWFSLENA